jgi:hypothetical protein
MACLTGNGHVAVVVDALLNESVILAFWTLAAFQALAPFQASAGEITVDGRHALLRDRDRAQDKDDRN